MKEKSFIELVRLYMKENYSIYNKFRFINQNVKLTNKLSNLVSVLNKIVIRSDDVKEENENDDIFDIIIDNYNVFDFSDQKDYKKIQKACIEHILNKAYNYFRFLIYKTIETGNFSDEAFINVINEIKSEREDLLDKIRDCDYDEYNILSSEDESMMIICGME